MKKLLFLSCMFIVQCAFSMDLILPDPNGINKKRALARYEEGADLFRSAKRTSKSGDKGFLLTPLEDSLVYLHGAAHMGLKKSWHDIAKVQSTVAHQNNQSLSPSFKTRSLQSAKHCLAYSGQKDAAFANALDLDLVESFMHEGKLDKAFFEVNRILTFKKDLSDHQKKRAHNLLDDLANKHEHLFAMLTNTRKNSVSTKTLKKDFLKVMQVAENQGVSKRTLDRFLGSFGLYDALKNEQNFLAAVYNHVDRQDKAFAIYQKKMRQAKPGKGPLAGMLELSLAAPKKVSLEAVRVALRDVVEKHGVNAAKEYITKSIEERFAKEYCHEGAFALASLWHEAQEYNKTYEYVVSIVNGKDVSSGLKRKASSLLRQLAFKQEHFNALCYINAQEMSNLTETVCVERLQQIIDVAQKNGLKGGMLLNKLKQFDLINKMKKHGIFCKPVMAELAYLCLDEKKQHFEIREGLKNKAKRALFQQLAVYDLDLHVKGFWQTYAGVAQGRSLNTMIAVLDDINNKKNKDKILDYFGRLLDATDEQQLRMIVDQDLMNKNDAAYALLHFYDAKKDEKNGLVFALHTVNSQNISQQRMKYLVRCAQYFGEKDTLAPEQIKPVLDLCISLIDKKLSREVREKLAKTFSAVMWNNGNFSKNISVDTLKQYLVKLCKPPVFAFPASIIFTASINKIIDTHLNDKNLSQEGKIELKRFIKDVDFSDLIKLLVERKSDVGVSEIFTQFGVAYRCLDKCLGDDIRFVDNGIVCFENIHNIDGNTDVKKLKRFGLRHLYTKKALMLKKQGNIERAISFLDKAYNYGNVNALGIKGALLFKDQTLLQDFVKKLAQKTNLTPDKKKAAIKGYAFTQYTNGLKALERFVLEGNDENSDRKERLEVCRRLAEKYLIEKVVLVSTVNGTVEVVLPSNIQKAFFFAQKLVKENVAMGHYYLGRYFVEKKDYEKAAQHFGNKALLKEKPEAMYYMHSAQMHAKKYLQAFNGMKKFVQQQKKRTDECGLAYWQMAQMLSLGQVTSHGLSFDHCVRKAHALWNMFDVSGTTASLMQEPFLAVLDKKVDAILNEKNSSASDVALCAMYGRLYGQKMNNRIGRAMRALHFATQHGDPKALAIQANILYRRGNDKSKDKAMQLYYKVLHIQNNKSKQFTDVDNVQLYVVNRLWEDTAEHPEIQTLPTYASLLSYYMQHNKTEEFLKHFASHLPSIRGFLGAKCDISLLQKMDKALIPFIQKGSGDESIMLAANIMRCWMWSVLEDKDNVFVSKNERSMYYKNLLEASRNFVNFFKKYPGMVKKHRPLFNFFVAYPHCSLGIIKLQNESYDLAIEHFKGSMLRAQLPKALQGWVSAVVAKYKDSDLTKPYPEEMENYLEELIDLGCEVPYNTFLLGLYYFRKGYHRDALICFEEAKKLGYPIQEKMLLDIRERVESDQLNKESIKLFHKANRMAGTKMKWGEFKKVVSRVHQELKKK